MAKKKRKSDSALKMALVKSQDERRLTVGVVYAAGKAPGRGADGFNDLAKAQELEDCAHHFMLEHQSVGLMHVDGTSGSGRVVESAIHRGPSYVVKAADGTAVRVGTGDWLLGVIWTPQAWQLIKTGQISGYSFQGAAKRRALKA